MRVNWDFVKHHGIFQLFQQGYQIAIRFDLPMPPDMDNLEELTCQRLENTIDAIRI